MELVQVGKQIKVKPITSKMVTRLVRLSWISLGVGLFLIPWRYAWIIQSRPQPPVYGDYTNLMVYAADLPLALALVLWLFSLELKPRRINLRPSALSALLAGLVLISTLSSFSSADPTVSFFRSIELLLFFGLYLFVINEVHTLSFLWVPAGMGLLVQAVVATGQALRQHSLGLIFFQELILDPSWKGVSIVLAQGVRLLRVYGLTNHPNLLGGCLAFAMLLLCLGFLEGSRGGRMLSAALFGLGAVALLLTFSRSAWLGLAAGLGLVGAWLAVTRSRDAFRRWAGLCLGAMLLIAPLAWHFAPFLGSRLNLDGSFSAASPENQSINERWLLLAQAGKLISNHLIAGVGVGAYAQAFHQAVPDYPFDYQPPHMVLAEVGAETGLPGAILYLSILAAPWLLLFFYRKNLQFSSHLAIATSLVMAVSVISFLDYYPWLTSAGFAWQWLIWGLWGGVYAGAVRQAKV